jgi:hypothetical protein
LEAPPRRLRDMLEDSSSFENPKGIDRTAVKSVIDTGRIAVVQFSEPCYTPSLIAEINQLCSLYGEKLQIRFYGHHNSIFDAKVLQHLPNVQNLAVDSLRRIKNEDFIGTLRSIKRLWFGVYEIDRPDFVRHIVSAELRLLGLESNKLNNFDLGFLMAASGIQNLFIEGHCKNIDALRKLESIKNLVLRCIPGKQKLAFVNQMSGLRVLKIVLGGRSNFDEIHHDDLNALNITWVRGLSSLGNLGRLKNLSELNVCDQLQLNEISLVRTQLEILSIVNCKSLTEIKGLELQTSLTKFGIYKTGMDLDKLADRQWPQSLRVLALFGTSHRKNEAMRRLLERRGYETRLPDQFHGSDLPN